MNSIPFIYQGSLETMKFPSPYNSIQIYLNAKLDSDLNWKKAQEKAKQAIEKDLKIVWKFDLGLFNELPLPLSDTTQYRSLHLALDHFFETFWPEFSSHTLGAILFEGSLDLTEKWHWQPDQIFQLRNDLMEHFETPQKFYNHTGVTCEDFNHVSPKDLSKHDYGKLFLKHLCFSSAVDYLEVLAARFPSELMPYVLLDISSFSSSFEVFQLLNHSAFDFMQLAIKGGKGHFSHALGWQTQTYANGYIGTEDFQPIESIDEPHVGILVPQNPVYDPSKLQKYQEMISSFEKHQKVRYVYERQLTLDWQNLDQLLVFEIEKTTKRKLEGFIAAGGQVIHGDVKLDISEQISYPDYKKQLEHS